ncbi:MAG: type II secretion system protein [Methylophilus sp.]|nr:type II secretion system protein [Methylophilus sp.]
MRVATPSCGFSFIELIITLAIVAILASVTMPLASVVAQRNKESELRHNLRQLREAIDAYKKASDEGRVKKENDDTGYPPDLDILVEGTEDLKDIDKKKIKFLRRIPIDPMQSNRYASDDSDAPQWGLRSYESTPDRPTAGQDVYDIYSLSTQIGTNGIPYAQW